MPPACNPNLETSYFSMADVCINIPKKYFKKLIKKNKMVNDKSYERGFLNLESD
jgi:hypothetical protein